MTRRSVPSFGADQRADQALSALRDRLAASRIVSAALEARCLVEAACGYERADLVANGHQPLGESATRLAALAARRLAGEPLARILGAREFWGLPFSLSPATLVPRPETETLVEAALRHCSSTRGKQHPWRILDLGTGSGCIGLSLLAELPHATLVALDRSFETLMTARGNARQHGVAARVSFIAGDWGNAIRASFDLVVANPPYVAVGDIQGLEVEVRDHDPRLALDGGADGLDAYRAIARGLPNLLAADGRAFLEVGKGQDGAVRALLESTELTSFSCHADLAGILRVVSAGPSAASSRGQRRKLKFQQASFEMHPGAP